MLDYEEIQEKIQELSTLLEGYNERMSSYRNDAGYVIGKTKRGDLVYYLDELGNVKEESVFFWGGHLIDLESKGNLYYSKELADRMSKVQVYTNQINKYIHITECGNVDGSDVEQDNYVYQVAYDEVDDKVVSVKVHKRYHTNGFYTKTLELANKVIHKFQSELLYILK